MFEYKVGDKLPLHRLKPELDRESFHDLLGSVREYGDPAIAPALSIQVVAFQEREALLECLDALVAQHDQDFEIVLVDNGLDDDIREALSRYTLRHLVLLKNEGCSQGRNIGALHCRAPLINFLDADGTVGPDHVAACKAAMIDQTVVAVRGKVISASPTDFKPSHYDLGSERLPCVISCEGISVWRKADFLRVGGFEVCLAGGEGPLLCYRMHAFYGYGLDSFYYDPSLVLRHDFFKSTPHLRAKMWKYALIRDAMLREFPLIRDMERYYSKLREGKVKETSGPLAEVLAQEQEKFDRESRAFYHKRAEQRTENADIIRNQESFEFTVVIPCYNLGSHIWDAVDSVLQQSLESVQLIIVDDCSDDAETIVELERLRAQFLVLRTTVNSGVSVARNLGIRHARAEHILCLDADDSIEPSYLEKAYHIFEADESVGIVSTWMQYHGLHSSTWCARDDVSVRDALISSPLPTASCFRKSAWHQVGGYDESMRGYEDWNFWISLISAGWRVRVIDEFLFNYLVRANSKVKTSDVNSEELLGRIITNHLDLFKEHLEYVLIARQQQVVRLRTEIIGYRAREKERLEAELAATNTQASK